MTKPTRIQLAYLAGIIDGEGTFNIYRTIRPSGRRKYTARIYVVNTNQRLIEWLQATFGGLIYSRPHHKWKTRYEWIFESASIDALLNCIQPFLIVKREQCAVVRNFRRTISAKRQQISEDSYELRETLYAQLKRLNS